MAAVDNLSLQEAADRLGVHYMTVYRWIRTGRLPAHRDGAAWRVDASDVERARRRTSDGAGAARPRAPSRSAAAARLRSRLIAGDEPGAWAVIEEVMASGATAETVHLEVIAPALRTIGDNWATGEVSVAEEHRATVVMSRILGRMGPQFARRGRKRGTVVVGAPPGEEHALPGSLLADILRGAGYDVVDLGANTPPASFVESAREAARVVAVLVGVTNPGNDANVAAVTGAVHGAGLGVPVLVGGGAIGGEDQAHRLGGDAWTGADARAVVATIEGLSSPASPARGPGARRVTRGQPVLRTGTRGRYVVGKSDGRVIDDGDSEAEP